MVPPFVREVSIFSRNGDYELSTSEDGEADINVSTNGGAPLPSEGQEPELDKVGEDPPRHSNQASVATQSTVR